MPFVRCFYHVIWATKYRAPLITPDVERALLQTVREKSQMLGCPILAIEAVEDHIHVAVANVPRIAVAEWVRQVKGLSSRQINALFPDRELRFAWQESYGVLTFGAKNLEFVVEYVNRQKAHHAANTLEMYLEQTE
ncbi:MAG: IS200/IS605 family transposase [Anaerolineae bacterium]|nr:IS200/IS605 family transposase [Anaerolineae bacterium]